MFKIQREPCFAIVVSFVSFLWFTVRWTKRFAIVLGCYLIRLILVPAKRKQNTMVKVFISTPTNKCSSLLLPMPVELYFNNEFFFLSLYVEFFYFFFVCGGSLLKWLDMFVHIQIAVKNCHEQIAWRVIWKSIWQKSNWFVVSMVVPCHIQMLEIYAVIKKTSIMKLMDQKFPIFLLAPLMDARRHFPTNKVTKGTFETYTNNLQNSSWYTILS